jgi:hypothetical protein
MFFQESEWVIAMREFRSMIEEMEAEALRRPANKPVPVAYGQRFGATSAVVPSLIPTARSD